MNQKERNKMTKTNKTYNFIEAVNSGKRFRTLDMTYSWLEVKNHQLVQDLMGDELHVEIASIINSQFELEEKTITITESEFDEAWHKFDGYLVDKLKKELGF